MKLFNEDEVDWPAYKQGQAAWLEYLKTNIKPINPFLECCTCWFSWNKGWNY